jgi:hypothetical protein
MDRDDHTVGLDSALRTVRAMLRADGDERPPIPFEYIEAYIVNTPLADEERALLWLYAWCEGQVADLREIAMAMAEEFACNRATTIGA